MIVDDLADRPHECNLLLDQNLGRTMDDYADLVPENCIVLIGPHFALLRSEFAAMREYSLERRASSRIKRLLISMGGVDMSNTTSEILETLKDCPLRDECGITVVMGSQSPWRDNVSAIAASMHWRVEVLTGIDEMARVMADSDLAIGAAGSTSWERCCLGLPTLLVVLSENQWDGARALAKAGAAILVGEKSTVREQLSQALTRITSDGVLVDVSLNASAITDGRGVMRVVEKINFSNE
jgi:UDP-2,4-diacetamido-2,4,6-trideoxy-beta-L-altropyranose hydrolase